MSGPRVAALAATGADRPTPLDRALAQVGCVALLGVRGVAVGRHLAGGRSRPRRGLALRGPGSRRPAGVRRAVLAACGVAVRSPSSPPRRPGRRAPPAHTGTDVPSSTGCPSPTARSPARHRGTRRPRPRAHGAGPGRRLPLVDRRARPRSRLHRRRVAAHWRAIYAANRARIGPDPDCIEPGSGSPCPERTCHDAPAPRVTSHSPVVLVPLTPIASVQGTLALDLGPRLELPEPDVTGRPGDSALLDVVQVDLVRRRRFEQHAARIGAAIVEIVGGDRPVSQVLRWTTPEVYQDLARRAHLVARTVGRRPGGRRHPVRCDPSWSPPTPASSPSDAPRSACTSGTATRSRAVAARFELIRDRWQVSALEFA